MSVDKKKKEGHNFEMMKYNSYKTRYMIRLFKTMLSLRAASGEGEVCECYQHIIYYKYK